MNYPLDSCIKWIVYNYLYMLMKTRTILLTLFLILQSLPIRAQVYCAGDMILTQNFSTMEKHFASDKVEEESTNVSVYDGQLEYSEKKGEYLIKEIPLHNALKVKMSCKFVAYNTSNNKDILIVYYFDGTQFTSWMKCESYQLKAESSELDCSDLPNLTLKFSVLLPTQCFLDDIVLKVTSVQTEYTRAVSPDKLATICLPMAVDSVDHSGATFFKIAGVRERNGNKDIVFEEVSSLQAGMPYIFLSNDDATEVKLQMDDKTGVASPLSENGLFGAFDDYAFKDDPGFESGDYYIINSQNQIQKASVNSGVRANRAFVKINEVPVYNPSSSSPGSRLLVLGPNGLSTEEVESVGLESIEVGSDCIPVYSLQGTRRTVGSGLGIRRGRVVFLSSE